MVETARSIVVKHFGGYDALSVEKHHLPPFKGKVEVRVRYGGINFADLYSRQGLMDRHLPFVLGIECMGVITNIDTEEIDLSTHPLKVGQRVICYNWHGGLFSDVVRINPELCFPIPDGVDDKAAAALFVNYLTAHMSIFAMGNLREGENVLVFSCVGGVGGAIVQLARTVPNVRIYGTSTSPFKEQQAINNGVDHFIHHSDDSPETIGKVLQDAPLFDVIICNQCSQPLLELLERHLEPLGRMVIIGANNLRTDDQPIDRLSRKSVKISLDDLFVTSAAISAFHLGILLDANRKVVHDTLGKLFDMITNGTITPKIHQIYDIKDIVTACKQLSERKNIGKVLIKFE